MTGEEKKEITMPIVSEEYFAIILKRVRTQREITCAGQAVEPGFSQTKNRAALIFALEVVLTMYREKHACPWSPLKGRTALEHLLLRKYKWTLAEIRSLCLQDIITALHEELTPNALPAQAQQVLKNYCAFYTRNYFDDITDDEWDPELYLTIQYPSKVHANSL